ncbi:hypothetical protein [Scytonema sp. NUACC21]
MRNETQHQRDGSLEINRGLTKALLTKYFQQSGKEWQISDRMDSGGSIQLVHISTFSFITE